MSKIRIQNRFGVVPNALLNQPTISLKAKGLYAYIQSKPDGWEFSSERIANDHSDGRDGIRSALKELEQNGYLIREKVRTQSGKFEMNYLLCEHPAEPVTGTENPSRTGTENPTPEKPTPENPASNKERDTNKEIEKKNTFGDFWNKYPKKEWKLAAEKAFLKLSKEEQQKAIKEISKHTTHWRKKYGEPNKEKFSTLYIPHAATWINGRRWEDIIETIPPPEKKSTPEDPEEAIKKKQNAQKIRDQEEKERQDQERKKAIAEQNKANAKEIFNNLTPEQQRQIIDKAEQELDFYEKEKEKYPRFYSYIIEQKILAITLQIYNK